MATSRHTAPRWGKGRPGRPTGEDPNTVTGRVLALLRARPMAYSAILVAIFPPPNTNAQKSTIVQALTTLEKHSKARKLGPAKSTGKWEAIEDADTSEA